MFERDSDITLKRVTVHITKRPTFLDVYAPTFLVKKSIRQKIVQPTIILTERLSYINTTMKIVGPRVARIIVGLITRYLLDFKWCSAAREDLC